MQSARVVPLFAALLLAAAPAPAQHVLRTYSWAALRAAEGVEVLPHDARVPFDRARIVNHGGQPMKVRLLTIEKPAIVWPTYAISGHVRYEGVEGRAYLQMMSFFPDGECSFARSLAASGPMGAFEGTSGWRPYLLPFFHHEGAPGPERLVVMLVLPGRGEVVLGPLALAEYRAGVDPLEAADGWWGRRGGGLVGGLLGGLVGCLGALIGVLGARGKARGFVLGAMKAMLLGGAVLSAVGILALARSQPFHVWWPLLLVGGLCVVLSAGLLPTVRKRYSAEE